MHVGETTSGGPGRVKIFADVSRGNRWPLVAVQFLVGYQTRALGPWSRGGTVYQAGQIAGLPETEAQALIAAGFATAA